MYDQLREHLSCVSDCLSKSEELTANYTLAGKSYTMESTNNNNIQQIAKQMY